MLTFGLIGSIVDPMRIGRPLQFDPDIALDSAMQLFWRKGYESTSLQDLLKAMNLSKSSFYQAFKSKKQLFEQSIQSYQSMLLDDLSNQLKQASSGKNFIESLFMDVATESSGSDARRGCLLMNTANEFSQTDPGIAALVSDSLGHITDTFEQAIIQAQQEGMIAEHKDSRNLALYLVSSMSGLKNMVKAGADRETIQRIVKNVLQILD